MVGDPAYRSFISEVVNTIKDRQSLLLLKELLTLVKFFQNKSMPDGAAVHGTTNKGATQDDLPHIDVDKMLEDFLKQSKVKLS